VTFMQREEIMIRGQGVWTRVIYYLGSSCLCESNCVNTNFEPQGGVMDSVALIVGISVSEN